MRIGAKEPLELRPHDLFLWLPLLIMNLLQKINFWLPLGDRWNRFKAWLSSWVHHSISWPQYSSSKMGMAVLQGYYCIKTTFITKLKKYFLSSLSILIPGKLSTCLGLSTTAPCFVSSWLYCLGPLCTCFWDLDPTLSLDK